MRFGIIAGLLVASLTVTAVAQKHQQPKVKPSYSAEREAKSSSRTAKPALGRNSTAQELHKLEQSSAKVAGSRRSDTGRAPRAPVLRAEKQERNPPINAAGSRGSKGSNGKRTADSSKGRLRHKGSHR